MFRSCVQRSLRVRFAELLSTFGKDNIAPGFAKGKPGLSKEPGIRGDLDIEYPVADVSEVREKI